VSNPLRTPADYELFIYSLVEKETLRVFKTIRVSAQIGPDEMAKFRGYDSESAGSVLSLSKG